MSEELKPCPFCPDGGDPQREKFAGKQTFIQCMKCDATASNDGWQNRQLHPPGTPQNPHKPGTAEKPTEVFKREWVLVNGEAKLFWCLDFDAMSENADEFAEFVDHGDVEGIATPLAGFTFINEVRP
mgnify:CR=1 FL=1